MSGSGEQLTDREMLIEIRGTVNRTAEDVQAVRRDHGNLAERVAKIETEIAFQRGSKYGFERGLRMIQGLCAICGITGIAAFVKILIGTGAAHG
jgi:hypothetical protein